jgi:para-aminobenzoate synthetase component I
MSNTTLTSHPKKLSWDYLPEEVAGRLAHLPGFSWLDTACGREGISILAALPDQWLRGNIRRTESLEQVLRGQVGLAQPDWGFPVSGLLGNVDYEGDYQFGLYRRWLVHRHDTAEWWDCGGLAAHLAPSPLPSAPVALTFTPRWSKPQFLAATQRAKDYIAAGDIYQVNLSHLLEAAWPAGSSPLALYEQLRERSPAPHAAYLSQPERVLLSSSPESFLQMSGQTIRTRPIKGTRPRHPDSVADQQLALELLASPKERAELLMITDLLRNDLGQVCEYGSVNVPHLLQLESFAQVHHLVSTVTGQLREGISHVAALAACFPGGSITGAPKRRAQEIIAELEGYERGPYTGAIGYFGSNGESQFNVAIRTVLVEPEKGSASFAVGAGIVSDSDAASEWDETWHKARGILLAAGDHVRSEPC